MAGVEGSSTTSSYKRDKAAKEKASAGSSHNWNTLFLGASAVADLMADKYGVDKKDVVLGTDSSSSSAAVRLALGETQIVAETKKFLEEQVKTATNYHNHTFLGKPQLLPHIFDHCIFCIFIAFHAKRKRAE